MANREGPSFFASATPQEAQQHSNRQRQADAMSYAQLPPGRGRIVNAYEGGAMIGNFGREDPQVVRAKKMEAAKAEVDQTGIDLTTNPDEYYKATIQSLQRQGLTQEAHQVYQHATNEAATKASTNLAQYEALSNRMKAEAAQVTALRSGRSGLRKEYVTIVPSDTDTNNMTEVPKVFGHIDSKKVQQAIAQGGVDVEDLKGNKETHTMHTRTVGENFDKRAENRAASRERIDAVALEATKAAELNIQLDSIDSALKAGTTSFGSLTGQREWISRFVTTFGTEAQKKRINKLVQMDVVDYDTVNKASKAVMFDLLRTMASGGRFSNQMIRTLEQAGPSVFLTNEGMKLTVDMLKKRAKKSLDAEDFLLGLRESAHYGEVHPALGMKVKDDQIDFYMHQWYAAANRSTAYSMTEQDVVKSKKVAADALVRHKIMSNARKQPPPKRKGTKEFILDGYPPGSKWWDNGVLKHRVDEDGQIYVEDYQF